jgi:hypothetical protein
MAEHRIGYVGKENVPAGAGFGGVLHLERNRYEFVSLCNQKLTMALDRDRLQNDSGYVDTGTLRICKRCQALAEKE